MIAGLLGSLSSLISPNLISNATPTSSQYGGGTSSSGWGDWFKTNLTGQIFEDKSGGKTASGGSTASGGTSQPITGTGTGTGLLAGSGTTEGSGGSWWTPLLTSALGSGLSSLGQPSSMGGGSSGPLNISQSQSVTQTPSINVTNLLGREFAGGTDAATGDFDVFKAIGDVFTIRDAMAAQAAPQGTTGGLPMTIQQSSKTNWTPILLIGGGAIALILILRGKK